MSSHIGRMVLSPLDPFRLPDRIPLIAALTDAGFLGSPLTGVDNAFAAGDRFLQLVIFAGCSVRIELAPGADGPFCHIRFVGPFRQPVFRSGRNTRPPRCPGCRSPLKSWKDRLPNEGDADTDEVPCPACGRASPPWDYDWKEKAGFGRLFLQIEEVFPGEATPSSGLMELLERTSGCAWQWFYIQDA